MQDPEDDSIESIAFSLGAFLYESKASLLLIAVNCWVFFWIRSLSDLSLVSGYIFSPQALLTGQWVSLLTSGFVHLELSHLLINMLGLFVFGRIVEQHLGFIRTVITYCGALIISLLFSTVVYYFFLSRNVSIVGASGAVMGLVSAAMLLDPFAITYEMIVPLPVMVKGWMFLYADIGGFIDGEADGVSHLAHLFGFASIALLVYFLSHEHKQQMKVGVLINMASIVVVLLIRYWWLSS